jgi:cytochrome c-type biogenesis protein CcmH/NrfG
MPLPMTPSTAAEPPADGSASGGQPYSPPSGATVSLDRALLTIELRRLAKLRDTGVVSDEEFDTSEPEHVESTLPELDRTDDPRGVGAVAWALLAVGVVLVVGVLLAAMWAAGAW